MPQDPNFKNGVGRLAVDRYDFQKHVDGNGFEHDASSIKLDPPLNINQTNLNNVQEGFVTLINVFNSSIAVQDATDTTKGKIKLTNDLTGTADNPVVAGLRNVPISNTTPTVGQILTYDGAVWIATTPSAGFSTGGDVSGTSGNLSVDKIKGKSVSSTTPTNYQTLVYKTGSASYEPTPAFRFESGVNSTIYSTNNISGASWNYSSNSEIILDTSSKITMSTSSIIDLNNGSTLNAKNGSRVFFKEYCEVDVDALSLATIYLGNTESFLKIGNGASMNLFADGIMAIQDGICIITATGDSGGALVNPDAGAISNYRPKAWVSSASVDVSGGIGSIQLLNDNDWISFKTAGRTVDRNFRFIPKTDSTCIWKTGDKTDLLTNYDTPGSDGEEWFRIPITSEFYGAQLKSVTLDTKSLNATAAAAPAFPGGVKIIAIPSFPYDEASAIDLSALTNFTYSTSVSINDTLTIPTNVTHTIGINYMYYLQVRNPSGLNQEYHVREMYGARFTVEKIVNQKI